MVRIREVSLMNSLFILSRVSYKPSSYFTKRHMFLNCFLFKKSMLVKILGILDIFIAVCFWLFGVLNIFNKGFILALGLILLAKGLVFVIGLNIMSILDIICGGLIILATFVTFPHIVVILMVLFLLQKGIFSML